MLHSLLVQRARHLAEVTPCGNRGKKVVDAWVPGDRAQRGQGRMDHLPSFGIEMGQGVDRTDPDTADRLAAVSQRLLSLGHLCDEETGVEPRRCRGGRDPMAEIEDPVRGVPQPLPLGQRSEAVAARRERVSVVLEPGVFAGVGRLERPAVAVCQEHAALLETLPNGGYPIA